MTDSDTTRAERVLDALEAVANITSGEWTWDDAHALLGDALAPGLMEYAHYLEAVLTRAGFDPLRARAECAQLARVMKARAS